MIREKRFSPLKTGKTFTLEINSSPADCKNVSLDFHFPAHQTLEKQNSTFPNMCYAETTFASDVKRILTTTDIKGLCILECKQPSLVI